MSKIDGVQYLKFFDNGYGVSIVKHNFSYGSCNSLWRLVVIIGDEEQWEIVCDTPITNKVLGCLTKKEVNENINKVSKLPLIKEYYAVAFNSKEFIKNLGPFDNYKKAKSVVHDFLMHENDPHIKFKIIVK